MDNELPVYSVDNIQTGNIYEIKIGNVYDLSKFWIIINFKELAVFNKYLTNVYTNSRQLIPHLQIKSNITCIIYRNNSYYRAKILPILLPEPNKIRVFMIDYGHIVNVDLDSVFYIEDKHKKVPRFAFRTTLSNILPGIDSEWSTSDLHFFCELIAEERLLAKVRLINFNHKWLFIELFKVCSSSKEAISINQLLVQQKIGIYCEDHHVNKKGKLSKYSNKIKFPHLFPSFEALEGGFVPCSLWERKLLADNIPLDMLYKYYYKYQPINSEI